MQIFSISQLSQFSGVKPHTIRIWEQRYGALTPSRTQGNTRFYDDNQLRRLLNIVSLQKGSKKISDLCALNDHDLYKLIEEQLLSKKSDTTAEYYISQLIAAGISYQEDKFEKLYDDALQILSIKDLYLTVLHPLLVRLGLLWSCDNIIPPQEHFICNLIKQKLYSYLDNLPTKKNVNAEWVLLLPENEFHEMGLLMAHIILKEAGKKVIYLGANIPRNSFINTVNETGANNILLFTVHRGQEAIIKQYADDLFKQTKNKQLFVSGNVEELEEFKNSKGITLIPTISELEKIIKTK